MTYDIENAAQDLMLETSDLKEILDIYFPAALELIAECEAAYSKEDYRKMAAAMHSLKGSSYNLRLKEIGDLASQYEVAAQAEEFPWAMAKLVILRNKVLNIQELARKFYDML